MIRRFTLPALMLLALGLSVGHAEEAVKGKEINETCAACHGAFGQGGKRGEYPRLAGQRAAYIEDQLRRYRTRMRMNIPMFPYTQERELPDEDIKEVAAYLAGVRLPTKMPDFKGNEDAYTRLSAMERVMIIPRAEGDVDNGRQQYETNCAECHGPKARGRARIPMLAGQYTSYLKRQIGLYLKGDRPHDEDDKPGSGVLTTLKEPDVKDILAYLTTLQDRD